MSRHKKRERGKPLPDPNPRQKESNVILPDKSPERTDEPEQAEALHSFRAAFGAATDLEAVTQDLFALHVYPGARARGEAVA
jgi:hypothetical protein